ncbi:MAG: ABC transporter substrate-binding protein, partial [Deltaproteobacteria bacterium]|nr:ABC transporter substrate-binding protein [Deltaproteobacteria bacterium]
KGAVYGGVYRFSSNAPRSLGAHQETYGLTTQVTNNTNNTLVRLTQDMTGVEPDLAKSWRRLDPLTYEFKIHKGVRFQDIPPMNGRELTSTDIKYSIQRVAGKYGKRANFKHRYYFEGKLASIETPDRYTVIFKTKEPYAPFIRYIAAPWSTIVPREAVEKYGDLKRKALGTGPFILKEFVRGSHIIMVKNPNYFKKGLPYLDKIHYKIMRDPAAILAAFLAGKHNATGFYFFQLPTVKKEAPECNIFRAKGTHMWVIRTPPWIKGKKPQQPPFDKRKVRQAIGHAIDKKRLLKLAWGGFGTVQIGCVPNFPPFSLPPEDQIEYNPEKAKKLLAEAGYPNGFNTEFITWNLSYVTKPAQVIKEMLAEVGINVNLKTMEMAQYFNKTYRFDYFMSLHIMTAAVDPEEMFAPYYGQVDKSTFYKWSNEKIWKAIAEQSRELDEKKRIAMIHKIQRMVNEDAPNLFCYTQYRFWTNRPYVHYKFYHNEYQVRLMEECWLAKH